MERETRLELATLTLVRFFPIMAKYLKVETCRRNITAPQEAGIIRNV